MFHIRLLGPVPVAAAAVFLHRWKPYLPKVAYPVFGKVRLARSLKLPMFRVNFGARSGAEVGPKKIALVELDETLLILC